MTPASSGHRQLAIAFDDALDAAVSAIEMARHADELSRLPSARDGLERVDGVRAQVMGVGCEGALVRIAKVKGAGR